MLDNAVPPEMMQQFLAAAHDPQKFQDFVGELPALMHMQQSFALQHLLAQDRTWQQATCAALHIAEIATCTLA